MILNHARLALVPTAAPASLRQRELEAGRLVLEAVRTRDPFIVRRALGDTRTLGASRGRRALVHATDALGSGAMADARPGLLAYGAVLERHGLHADAAEVYRGLLEIFGEEAGLALHAARATRRCGDRAEAMRLYGIASAHAAGNGMLELLAAIGGALLADEPILALAPVIRRARRERLWEAYAVAREERARAERAGGQGSAALRDLIAAFRRYADRQDRMRVLHAIADILVARGDVAGAREALLAALELARPSMREHTVQRLRALARVTGDELELRRTRGHGASAMVALLPPRARASAARSLAPRLARLRDLLVSHAPAPR